MAEVKIHVRDAPYVPAGINGRGPFWLLSDTGCIGCRVTTAVAERLSLKTDESGVAVLRTFSVGSTQWCDMRFGVDDNPPVIKLLDWECDGFLGNGFVYHVRGEFCLTIDYPKQTLGFPRRRTRAKAPTVGDSVQISIENYYTIVPVRVNGRGPY